MDGCTEYRQTEGGWIWTTRTDLDPPSPRPKSSPFEKENNRFLLTTNYCTCCTASNRLYRNHQARKRDYAIR